MVEEQDTGIGSIAPELGVFYFLSLLVFFGFMRRTRGRFRYINAFIASRNWSFLADDKALVSYMGLLRFIILAILSWPALTLSAWFIALLVPIIRDDEDNKEYLRPVGVLLLSVFILFMITSGLLIRWQKFRISRTALTLFLLGISCFVTFQLIVVFLQNDIEYFGPTAIFLSLNGIVVVLIIFFLQANVGKSINDIIEMLPEGEEVIYPDNIVSAKELVELDKEREVTKTDIFSLYSLPKASKDGEYSKSSVSGGIQAIFTSKFSGKAKFWFIVFLYLLSVSILIAYVLLMYSFTNYEGLGLITAIEVASLDIIVFMYIYARMSRGPFEESLMSLLGRLLIFSKFYSVLGEEGWFWGYSATFFIFSMLTFFHLIDQKLPTLGNVVQKQRLERDRKHIQYVKFTQSDVAKRPEFIWALFSVIYFVFLTLVGIIDPEDVPNTTYNDFQLWQIALIFIVATVVIFLVLVTLRIFYRKLKQIKDTISYYFCAHSIDLYWMVTSVTVIILWIVAAITYLIIENESLVILLFFLPVIITILLTGYAGWVSNDYAVVLDISEYNEKNQKRRQKEEQIIERIKKYSDSYLKYVKGQNDGNIAQIATSTFSQNLFKQGTVNTDQIQEQGDNAIEVEDDITEEEMDQMKLKHGIANIDDLLNQIPKDLPDWSKEQDCCGACFSGNLQKTDYVVLFSILFGLLLNILMAITDYFIVDSLTYGTSIAVLIVILCLVCLPLNEYVSTANPLDIYSWSALIFGTLLNFAYGIIYYLAELDEDTDDDNDAINVIILTFFFPVLVPAVLGIVKWKDNSWKTDKVVYSIMVVGTIFTVLFCLTVMAFVDLIAGIALLVADLIIICYAGVGIVYVNNDFYLPKGCKWFAIILTASLCLLAFAVGLAIQELGPFAGFSITYFAVIGFLSIYTLSIWIRSIRYRDSAPIFFSPWIFPIYKYSPVQERIAEYNRAGILIYLVIFMVNFWSILAVIWVDPVDVGISVGSLSLILLILISIYISGISPLQLAEAAQFVDGKDIQQVTKAWLQAKLKYLNKKGATFPDDIATFADRKVKLAQLELWNEALLHHHDYDFTDRDTNKAWLDTKCDLNNLRNSYAEMFREDMRVNNQYLSELELIIHFQLLIIIRALSGKSQEVMFLNNLLAAKRVELNAFGINIVIADGLQTSEKYQRAIAQIEKLDPIKRIRFENIKEMYIKEQQELKQEQKIREKEELEAQQKRQEQVAKLREERLRQAQEQQNQDVPIDQMIDSPEKYAKIVAKFKQDGIPFTDTQFLATDAQSPALGPLSSRFVAKWQRAGEECVLYEGGVSPEDVKQGALGDCYFLSAITVLGQQKVTAIFEGCIPDPRCGAYILRFYRGAHPEYVIVDNIFPVAQNDKWSFCKTVSGTELWPMLLEKAYAKLHGSYDNIVGGKVQFALADLTGGAPEQIKLQQAQNNPDGLWQKMLKFKQLGYLMGAGSPENARGDAAVSEMGIVQGHAYSVLDVQELDGQKLIQIKNPHGQHGVEWRGDWSDGSFLWTKKFKGKLNYSEKPDGIFWMSLEDFVYEYANLYICRLFDPKIWNTLPVVSSAWQGKSAAGLRCRQNPDAIFGNNPQYSLKVSKPCEVFITLTQEDTTDMFRGELFIVFMLFRSKSRVEDPTMHMISSSGSPTNLKTISAEINLDSAGDYVVVVANMIAGPKGEGQYSLQLILNDFKAVLKPMQ